MINVSKVEETLRRRFSNYQYHLSNVYLYEWESDFFAISKSGYSIEVEIKVSKSDFKTDFKKTTRTLTEDKTKWIKKHDYLLGDKYKNKANKFYFACPEGLINIEDIDPKYGLIWITKFSYEIKQEAKFLHKEKSLEKIGFVRKLTDKFYWKYTNLKHEMRIYKSSSENLF